MLDDHEASFVCSADHEGEEAGFGDATAILSADVNEDGARAVPVLITDPVSLVVSSVIEVVEMINHVLECAFFELSHIN